MGRTGACTRRAGLTRSSRKRAPTKAFGGFFLPVLLTEELSSSFGSKFFSPELDLPSFLFADAFLCDLVAGVF